MIETLQLEAGWTAQTAGATESKYLVNARPQRVRLVKAYIVPDAALTANDSNYKTFSLRKDGTEIVTARATTVAGGGFTAGTPVELTILPATGAALELAQGEVHEFRATHTASGVAFTGRIVGLYEPVRS